MLYYGQRMRRDQIEAYKWFLIARDNGVRRSAEAARILDLNYHQFRYYEKKYRESMPTFG